MWSDATHLTHGAHFACTCMCFGSAQGNDSPTMSGLDRELNSPQPRESETDVPLIGCDRASPGTVPPGDSGISLNSVPVSEPGNSGQHATVTPGEAIRKINHGPGSPHGAGPSPTALPFSDSGIAISPGINPTHHTGSATNSSKAPSTDFGDRTSPGAVSLSDSGLGPTSTVPHRQSASGTSLKAVSPGSRTSLKAVSPGSRTSLKAVSPGSRTSLKAVSPGSRTSLKEVSPGSRTSLKEVSPGSRTSLKAVSPGSRTSLKAVSPGSRTSLKAESPGNGTSPKAESPESGTYPKAESPQSRTRPEAESPEIRTSPEALSPGDSETDPTGIVPLCDPGSRNSPTALPPLDAGLSPSRTSLKVVPSNDSGMSPSAVAPSDSKDKISPSAMPPGDLGLNHDSPITPTTNGNLAQDSRTGFKSGKVSPSPVDSTAASPAQKGVRKGAWERAQEKFEAEEQQAQQQNQAQPPDYDTNFALSEKHFTVQKVGQWSAAAFGLL